jgi:hypothetical protein
MTSRTALVAHYQAYRDRQSHAEEEAFADFCHNAVRRAINNAKVGQREYVAVLQFTCTISKDTMQRKFEDLFPGCDIQVCMKTLGDAVDSVIVRW